MGLITTKQLMDEYFAGLDEERVRKTRGMIDRKELYAYEEAIGKELLDMNLDEIFEMFKSFYNGNFRAGTQQALSYSTFLALVSAYRQIFDYYSDHYELIRNPMRDAKLKGYEKTIQESVGSKKIGQGDLEAAIKQLHDKNAGYEDRGDYYELIVRLFYDGFADGEEIATIKRDMVLPESNEIMTERGTIHVSDRTMELLEKFNSRYEISLRGRQICDLVGWRGGYFKFIIKKNTPVPLDDREPVYVSRMINDQLKRGLKETDYSYLNGTILYYFGFYNFLIDKCGKEKTDKMIMSRRDKQEASALKKYALAYHLQEQNTTRLRSKLIVFV